MSISNFSEQRTEEKPFKRLVPTGALTGRLEADLLIKVRDTNDTWQICRGPAWEGRCPIGNRKSAIEN
jgi:hypothetical protein